MYNIYFAKDKKNEDNSLAQCQKENPLIGMDDKEVKKKSKIHGMIYFTVNLEKN